MTDDIGILPAGPSGEPIGYVCLGAEHLRIGRGRPDGTGPVTVYKERGPSAQQPGRTTNTIGCQALV